MKKEISINSTGYGVYELICRWNEISEHVVKTINRMIASFPDKMYYIKPVGCPTKEVYDKVEAILLGLGYEKLGEYYALKKDEQGQKDIFVDLDEFLSIIQETQVVTCSLDNAMISIFETSPRSFEMDISLICMVEGQRPAVYEMLNHVLLIELVLGADYFTVVFSKESHIAKDFIIDIFKHNDFGLIKEDNLGKDCLSLIFKKEKIKEKILER